MNVATAGATQDIAARIAAVQETIAAAALRAGRDPADVTLVAVSKSFPLEQIWPAIDAGVRDLGENRVQEAEAKVAALPPGVRWHLVGHLQSNKVNRALELFSLIHSVDTVALGEAIARRASGRGAPARVLLQVNVAQKATQFGFGEAAVVEAARRLAGTPGLLLEGLMCIAPEVEPAALSRPYFRRLADLHRQLISPMRESGHPWRHLSMGMTNDYPTAVEEGATLVRVGRAVFGERTGAAAAGVGTRG